MLSKEDHHDNFLKSLNYCFIKIPVQLEKIKLYL